MLDPEVADDLLKCDMVFDPVLTVCDILHMPVNIRRDTLKTYT